MLKIKDRVTLGVVAGFIANILKQGCSYLLRELNLINITTTDKAAAMFISKNKTRKKPGFILGVIADFCIACKLGILLVYYISATGKDNYLLKGWSLGSIAWATMYGLLSRLGGSGFSLIKPRDSLSGFVTHVVYGLAASQLIIFLGDEGLFKPKYQTLGNPEGEN